MLAISIGEVWEEVNTMRVAGQVRMTVFSGQASGRNNSLPEVCCLYVFYSYTWVANGVRASELFDIIML